MLGDALTHRRLLRQQPCGMAVALCPLGGRELRIDTAAHHRMNERHRPAGLEIPAATQQLGGLGGLRRVEARESRRLDKVPLLEHRKRPSEPPRVFRQPAEPEVDRATDRSGPESLNMARSLRRRSDPTFAQRFHEHADQEWCTACAQAGVDEYSVRPAAEPRLHELGDRCS